MNNQMKFKSNSFHNYLDKDILYRPFKIVETIETKHFVIQEREISYRFYLHQHPFIQTLTQRLLRKGINGLQAADTEYSPNETSLPYGVDADLNSDMEVLLSADVRVVLLRDASATDNNNNLLSLKKYDTFILGNECTATIPKDTTITAVEPCEQTPYPGIKFSIQSGKNAVLNEFTRIKLPVQTEIMGIDGKTYKIKNETDVVLETKTTFSFSNSTEVTVKRRRMRPVRDFYTDFFSSYNPDDKFVQPPYPVKDLDFTSSGAYSVYNWEMFYHVPFTVAIHLSKNQLFAEAQRWFHYLFDPTDDNEGPTPERFWKVRPFQYTDVKKIEEILLNIATGEDITLHNDTINSITAWKNSPFRPHVIARYRQQAYMYKTVMAYLDNLIAWGDSLFRQDTGEAIDEALILYVLAANILGPRPLPVPKKGNVRAQTYNNLRKDLNQFGAVIKDIEPEIPFDLMPIPDSNSDDNEKLATVRSLGKALYFCVPRNDKLISYWDNVADRLFKIRNSLNIQGTFRQLALFEPPIDPALLARATAAGLDIGAIVNGLNQPLPLVRFTFLVQRASEIVQEVKSLGNNLLSVMEKEDGEALAILRAKHEHVVMEMVEQIKYGQLQEAIKTKEGLVQTLALAIQRYTFYERQLGKKAEEIEKSIPQLAELDKENLIKMKLNMEEPNITSREIEVDIAQDLGDSGGKIISSYEKKEIEESHEAHDWQDRASLMATLASASYYVPEFSGDLHFWGMGATIEFGGKHIGPALQAISEHFRNLSTKHSYNATHNSKVGEFQKREQDWSFQSNLAAGEISQIFKQIRAAQIREAIAELELKNHRQQMKHAEEIENFLNEEGTNKKGKKTNKALYVWMKREVKGLYAQCFQFAFDIAKKAERALQHELGNPDLSYLQFGYLAGKEGLLAGEKLYLDVKRMEIAYHELNQREYELTKSISLLQLDPLALIQLRMTGRCTLQIPEMFFDIDCPGHYFRRIKSVAVSIPCITGPFTSVNCKLTLTKSSIRKSSIMSDDYARTDAEDSRFSDFFGSMQSIVTSSAQNDSGLFETNLRDERYLPFENSGVISEWQIELPANPSNGDPAQFDYNTISDVILHIRYTAREGGGLLRAKSIEHIKQMISEAKATGTARLFSVRNEFPTEWMKFKTKQAVNNRYELKIKLSDEHYPFWSKGKLNKIDSINLLARSDRSSLTLDIYEQNNAQFIKDIKYGKLLFFEKKLTESKKPVGELNILFDSNSLEDLWIVINWNDA